MSHAIEIENLIQKLIQQGSAKAIKDARVDHNLRVSLKTISESDTRRTNPFEIYGKATGVVEKLRILNREDVADELDGIVNELKDTSWKWIPETLALLLLLSDRPTIRSIVDERTHHDFEVTALSSLAISVDEDSSTCDESGLWNNVDFSAPDTDDDADSLSTEETKENELLDTPPSDARSFDPQTLIVPQNSGGVPATLSDPYWRGHAGFPSDRFTLTELQATREVLHMLLGLPTSVFTRKAIGTMQFAIEFEVRHVSEVAMLDIWQKFCDVGGQLDLIRYFAKQVEANPVMQRCQSILAQKLGAFEAVVNEEQSRTLDDYEDYVVSLMVLYDKVVQSTLCLRQMHHVLRDLGSEMSADRPLRLLSGLYDATCSAQSIGDEDSYRFLAEIFLECFEMYQRPLRLWIEEGELEDRNQTLFIARNRNAVPLEHLWQEQFSLIRDDKGALLIPNFLQIGANSIFNTGKSVYMLKALGVTGTSIMADRNEEDKMTFSSVCSDHSLLSPFQVLFETAFNEWIERRHHSSSDLLRCHLEKHSKFQDYLDTLEYVYLYRDNSKSDSFLLPIFERLDGRRRHWNDALLLTDLLQYAFGAKRALSPADLIVQVLRSSHNPSSAQPSMKALEILQISYQLPWPIANIIQPASILVYQNIFVFVAQLQRAKFLLHRHKLSKQKSANHWMQATYKIRLLLLHFTDSILTHLLLMVIDPQTIEMRRKMVKAIDIDDMRAMHAEYVRCLEDRCLLTPKHASLKQAIISTLDLTILFSKAISDAGRLDRLGGDTSSVSIRAKHDSSSDDDEDEIAEYPASEVQDASHTAAQVENKLKKIEDTFSQLHNFVTASVRVLSKAEGTLHWEILASNLAASNERD